MRALRVDKMTYAALEATLTEYAAGRAAATVPTLRMLMLTADEIRARARTALIGALGAAAEWRADLVSGMSAIGGGQRTGRRVADVARRDHEKRSPAGTRSKRAFGD